MIRFNWFICLASSDNVVCDRMVYIFILILFIKNIFTWLMHILNDLNLQFSTRRIVTDFSLTHTVILHWPFRKNIDIFFINNMRTIFSSKKYIYLISPNIYIQYRYCWILLLCGEKKQLIGSNVGLWLGLIGSFVLPHLIMW
jgi:hypothetical protein